MARPYAIKECFETEIRENDKALAELKATIADTANIRKGAENVYKTRARQFALSLLTPLDIDGLNKLSAAAGADFVKTYNDQMEQTRTAERQYAAQEVTTGGEDAVAAKLRSVESDLRVTANSISDGNAAVSMMSRSLSRIDDFNSQYKDTGKQLIDAAGIEYFGSKKGIAHFFKKLFNRHYRIGTRLVNEFGRQENSADPKTAIVQTQAALKSAREKLPQLQNAQQDLKNEKATLEDQQKTFTELSRRMIGDDGVVDRVANDIVRALDNADVFNAAVKAFPKSFDEYIIENRAKVDALAKFEGEAQKKVTALESASKSLEKHLPKLRKAGSSSKDVKIDLDAIKKSMNAQRAMAKHSAKETKRAGEKIRDFAHGTADATVYAAANALDIYTQFLIIDMISDAFAGPDAHAVNAALGIPSDVAAGAGIDLGNLMPDFSHDFSGLTDTFNSVNFDTSVFDNINMPDIDLSSVMNSLSDTMSSIGDNLSDFGSSIGDSFGGGFDL